jgi:hypothetical protein
MRGSSLLAALLVLCPTAEASAWPTDRFDLDCKGWSVSGRPREEFKVHLRVDLARRVFCADRCEYLYPVTQISGQAFQFRAYTVFEGASRHWPDRIAVRRADWTFRHAYTVHFDDPTAWYDAVTDTASCTVEPFSGIKASTPLLDWTKP